MKYDEQIIAPPAAESPAARQLITNYGFQGEDDAASTQKRAAVSGGFEVDNREASNRVDRSHSVSKKDAVSNEGESLILGK
jgi:hypothetical protein